MSSQSPVEGASFNKSETPVYSPQTHPEVFPVLTAEELEQCQQFGSVCHFAKGEKIIAARQPVNACYVVLSAKSASWTLRQESALALRSTALVYSLVTSIFSLVGLQLSIWKQLQI
jgi:hypothetical protein